MRCAEDAHDIAAAARGNVVAWNGHKIKIAQVTPWVHDLSQNRRCGGMALDPPGDRCSAPTGGDYHVGPRGREASLGGLVHPHKACAAQNIGKRTKGGVGNGFYDNVRTKGIGDAENLGAITRSV